MFWRQFYFLFMFLCLLPKALLAADQRAILDLSINEVKKGEVVVFLQAPDVLVRVKDLEAAGLKSFAGRRENISGDDYVLLGSLAPQVSFKLDERDLTLSLTAQPSLLGYNLLEIEPNKPPDIIYSEDASGFLNYSVNLRDFKRTDAFGEFGITIKNSLLYSGILRNGDGSIVRGLSNLTISDRQSLNRTVVGDRLVSSDLLGGSLAMGGIGFFRDFGLDPYFVQYPGLNFSGAVSTPSTVDVYVNGQLLRRVPLPPGQFELKDLPVPAGTNNTRLILRDAFGREREIGSQYYFAAGLLKEGLHEFSYNFGSRRNNLATESWDYGPLVFLARHRLGITDYLTAGLRFEASSGLVSGGPSATLRTPLGEIDVAAAASASRGLPGGGTFLGYNYIGPLFNAGGFIKLLSPHYATTILKAGDDRSWMELNAFVGLSVTSRLGVSLRYTFENSNVDGQRHGIALSTTTRLTDRVSLLVSGGHSQQRNRNGTEIFSGLTFLFGEVTGSVSYENRGGVGLGTAVLQKSLPVSTGFGYRFQASTTQNQNFAVDSLLQYQGPYGRYEANYSRLDGQDSTVLNVAGGLAVIGKDFFLTRPVQESFAVIRVPGVADVRGYASNQEVGSTSSNGNLFVPSLLPYYGNKLSISDKDIPLNYTIDATDKVVAPPFRGGAVVTFPVQRIQRSTGTVALQDSKGSVIPAYGQLTVTANGKQFESPVGKQGEFYLENVPPGRHRAIVEYKDKTCGFVLDVPSSAEPFVQLGNVRCQMP
jgi:outer membrane usher protein